MTQPPAREIFKPKNASPWTAERIARLPRQEVEQLRSNASALGEQEVVVLCEEALRTLPKGRGVSSPSPRTAARMRRLISRRKAFEARGVHLEDERHNWSGVRKSDGIVVMTLWADAIKVRDGACNYLLWAPNVDGTRAWYETPAGQDRLKHCQLVPEGGTAEGLLVHGERLEGHLPEDRARSVHGVDPEIVVRFRVEKHGPEYWAVWGNRSL